MHGAIVAVNTATLRERKNTKVAVSVQSLDGAVTNKPNTNLKLNITLLLTLTLFFNPKNCTISYRSTFPDTYKNGVKCSSISRRSGHRGGFNEGL